MERIRDKTDWFMGTTRDDRSVCDAIEAGAAPMTPDAQQPEHCEHECVCPEYRGNDPCNGVWIPQLNEYHKCKHDTRSRPHTPAPERIDEILSELRSLGWMVAIHNAVSGYLSSLNTQHSGTLSCSCLQSPISNTLLTNK